MAYGANDLKEDIKKKNPEVEKLRDISLSPMLDVLLRDWFKELGKSPDVSSLEQKTGIDNSSQNRQFDMIINGKFIKIFEFCADMYAGLGHGEKFYMAFKISYSGDFEQFDYFIKSFREFVAKRKMADIMKEAKEELGKAKEEFFFDELKRFYLQ